MLSLSKRFPFRVKLIGALLLPLLIVLVTTYVLLTQTFTDIFQDFQVEGGRMRADEIKKLLANYYSNRGSWDGVEAFIRNQYQQLSDEVGGRSLLLTNQEGQVIASSDGQLEGEQMESEALADGVPIEVAGQQVGVLLVGPVADNFSPRETMFLNAFHRSLLVTGLIGLLIAMIAGLLFLRNVLSPLRTLTRAAQGVKAGHLNQAVPVETKDELGSLACAFNDMADHLTRSERARRAMVADIAHELRTPIAAIQCNLEAVLAGAFKPSLESIAPIYDQTLLLSRLVTDLQELSLAESGELPLKKTRVDLVPILQRIALMIRPQLEEQGIRFTLTVPEIMPLLEVDRERIEQVLLNLLSNAQRYTPVGGEIQLEALACDDCIQVNVSDTGSGIPPEELPLVFQRFYRADRSRSRSTGGAGLGLAIAKQLVEAHGGRIWVESDLQQGTAFHVVLPLRVSANRKKK